MGLIYSPRVVSKSIARSLSSSIGPIHALGKENDREGENIHVSEKTSSIKMLERTRCHHESWRDRGEIAPQGHPESRHAHVIAQVPDSQIDQSFWECRQCYVRHLWLYWQFLKEDNVSFVSIINNRSFQSEVHIITQARIRWQWGNNSAYDRTWRIAAMWSDDLRSTHFSITADIQRPVEEMLEKTKIVI